MLTREISQGVATLTLNRPESKNALSADILGALYETLSDVEFSEEGVTSRFVRQTTIWRT